MVVNFVYDLEDIPAKNTKSSFKMIFIKLLSFFKFFMAECKG